MTIAFIRSLIDQKVETVQVHFTLEGEGLTVQRNYYESLYGYLHDKL